MSNNNLNQKEWLSFLDTLHNKLRGSKGIKLTQMPALYEISNFMLFRFLDSEKIIGIKHNLIVNTSSYIFHSKTLYLTFIEANSFDKIKIKEKLNNYEWTQKINEFSINYFKSVNDRIDELIKNKNK